MPTQDIGKLVLQILLDDGGVSRGADRAERRLWQFRGNVVSLAADIDRALTTAFERFGLAAVGALTAASTIGAAFEKRMDEVGAVSRATADEMVQLTEKARQIGEVTAFSARDAADAMVELARAGLNARQVIQSSQAATVLAGAGNIELARAADLVTSAIAQFSLQASEATRVADVFTAVTQQSRFSFESLPEAMKYAGTVGAALGMTLEETTASVAQFVELGLEGSTAGTNFREAMLSLLSPTKKAREALDALGLTVADVDPRVHGFAGVMTALGKANLDAAKATDIFGLRAGANVTKIAAAFADGTSKFQSLNDALVHSAGIADATYTRMMDNVAGRWDNLTSSLEEAALTVFEAIRGPLDRLLTGLTDRVRAVTTVLDRMSNDGTSAADRLVDGILRVVDAVLRLTPYLEDAGKLLAVVLLGAKGVQWSAAALNLARALDVDLVGAFRALNAVLATTSATGGLVLGMAGAGVVAGVLALASAIARLATELTGSAEAARRLRADLEAVAALQAGDRARQEELGRLLALTQADVRARQDRGEAIAREEEALLRLDAATALSLEQQGRLIQVGQRLTMATELDAETRRDQARVLGAQAEEYDRLARIAGELAANFRQVGTFDLINNLANAPGLEAASQVLGRQVQSYEDLLEAQRLYALQADRTRATRSRLLNDLALEAAEAKRSAGATDDQTQALGEQAAVYQTEVIPALHEADGLHADLATGLRLNAGALDQVDRGGYQAAEAMTELSGASQLVALAWGSVTAAWGGLQGALADLGRSVGEVAVGALERLRDAATGLLDDVWGAARSVADGIVDLFRPMFQLADIVTGALDDAADAQDRLTDARTAASEARQALAEARAGGDQGSIDRATETARAARDELAAASAAAALTTPELAAARVRAAAESAVAFVRAFADALPTILQAITEQIPVIAREVVDAIPRVTQAVIDQVPVVIGAVVDAAPKIMAELARSTPILVRAIMEQVPRIVRALVMGLVDAIRSLPELLDAILDYLPEIIMALAEGTADVVTALADAIPQVIDVMVEHAPEIAIALADSMPTVVAALIRALPQVVAAMQDLLPELISSFWSEFASASDGALWNIFSGGIIELAKAAADAFLEIVSFGLYQTGSKRTSDQAQTGADALMEAATFGFYKSGNSGAGQPENVAEALAEIVTFGLFRSDKTGRTRAASGIDWVPSTMSAILEPGEAVLTAAQNAARLATGVHYAPPAPGAGVANAPAGGAVRVEVALDGQVVDSAIHRSMAAGRMPQLRRTLAAPGVKPGVSRGRWSPRTG